MLEKWVVVFFTTKLENRCRTSFLKIHNSLLPCYATRSCYVDMSMKIVKNLLTKIIQCFTNLVLIQSETPFRYDQSWTRNKPILWRKFISINPSNGKTNIFNCLCHTWFSYPPNCVSESTLSLYFGICSSSNENISTSGRCSELHKSVKKKSLKLLIVRAL